MLPKELSGENAVMGGSVGGCAATLAALDAGHPVILAEPTAWIGGQLTTQRVPPDEHAREMFRACLVDRSVELAWPANLALHAGDPHAPVMRTHPPCR